MDDGGFYKQETESRLEVLPATREFQWKYKVNRHQVLGKGSFGIVYPGVRERILSGRKSMDEIAVKVIRIKGSKSDYECLRQDFQRQLAVYEQVKDFRHVVKLYDCVRKGDQLFFVMQRCDQDFSSFWLKVQSQIQADKRGGSACNYFVQVILGYKQLFQKKIVHNDLKAENILVKQNLLKLADFGLSQQILEGGSSRFAKKNLSWKTTAPQVRFSNLNCIVDEKSDMWALGAILYWMVYKAYPFQENSPCQDYRLRRSFAGVSGGIKTVLDNLLEFQSQKRWGFQQLSDYCLLNRQWTDGQIEQMDHRGEGLFDNESYKNIRELEDGMFQTPNFIQLDLPQSLSLMLMRAPTIQEYASDMVFDLDRSQARAKASIKQHLSIFKLKIKFLKVSCKRVQSYSVSSFKDKSKVIDVLFYKKVLMEGIRACIARLYQLLGNGGFLPEQVHTNARKQSQLLSYLKYLQRICTEEVTLWISQTLQQKNLLKNYQSRTDRFSWLLKSNWDAENQDFFDNLQVIVKEFLVLLKYSGCLSEHQYVLIHHLLILRQLDTLFSQLSTSQKCQTLSRYISYGSDPSYQSLNTHTINRELQQL